VSKAAPGDGHGDDAPPPLGGCAGGTVGGDWAVADDRRCVVGTVAGATPSSGQRVVCMDFAPFILSDDIMLEDTST
jgi:hypothetical protein